MRSSPTPPGSLLRRQVRPSAADSHRRHTEAVPTPRWGAALTKERSHRTNDMWGAQERTAAGTAPSPPLLLPAETTQGPRLPQPPRTTPPVRPSIARQVASTIGDRWRYRRAYPQ